MIGKKGWHVAAMGRRFRTGKVDESGKGPDVDQMGTERAARRCDGGPRGAKRAGRRPDGNGKGRTSLGWRTSGGEKGRTSTRWERKGPHVAGIEEPEKKRVTERREQRPPPPGVADVSARRWCGGPKGRDYLKLIQNLV